MGSGARRFAGIGAAVLCLAAAYTLRVALLDADQSDRIAQAKDRVSVRARSLGDSLRRSIDQLQMVAVSAAAVQDLQLMVGSGVDANTFHDYLANEVSWKGFRTPPFSSAIYLGKQRIAQTSDAFPDESALGYFIDVTGVNGRGALVTSRGELTAVAAARLPVVTRGDAPREAVVMLARPFDRGPLEGLWLVSDGRRALAHNGAPESIAPLAELLGRERESQLVLSTGAAAAVEVQPGLWVWTSAPLGAPGSQGPLSVALFATAGGLALVALLFAFRTPSTDPREKILLDAAERLQQSQEQLKRLTQQLDTIPRPPGAGPLERTSPSLSAIQPSRYEVISQLGTGGMAIVYLAVTRGVEGFTRAFVVKRLRPEMLSNPDAVTQFIDEARLGSSLVHSNIVPIFDFGRDAEGYYLAQEYILGRDVDAVILASQSLRNTALELPLVFYLAQEALQALGYAHSRVTPSGESTELVHRDVSPNNLMVSAQGEIKLLDLGIAKSRDNLTKTQNGMIKGNVFYMSPEQARALPIDRRADLFSLGLVLYTAHRGVPLYQGATTYELIQRAAGGLGPNEWERIRALPAALATLLTRALDFDPAKRFASAEEFARAIPKELIGQATAMQALMETLFADDFRREMAKLRVPGTGA